MFKILITMITFGVLSLADGPVLQTGQTQSYDDNGDIVTDGSVKDDGYYQAGVSRDYSRNGDIIIDNTTGLEWEDNEYIRKPWVTQANYSDGNYSDTSGDTATTYCEEFTLGGHEDWRLPSIEELRTIVDNGRYNPSTTDGVFQNISFAYKDYYWSDSTIAYDTSTVWFIDFSSGYLDSSTKENSHYVRCVRGRQFESTSLSRSGEIVTDSTTTLQWQDDAIAEDNTGTWIEAIDYCENNLTLGGYSDWRLPNRNELLSIIDRARYWPAIDISIFANTATYGNYWSSTTDITLDLNYNAWLVGFSMGASGGQSKNYDHFYIRCVRGGQSHRWVCPEGQHLKQGERVCIPGTIVANPSIWLPNCVDGQLIQGTTEDCNASAILINPPGFTLPTCPDGERLEQGSNQCTPDGI